MPPERRSALATAIGRRMRLLGLGDAASYAGLLGRDESALEELAADITVGETYFFRDPAQFALLREQVLPELAGRNGRETIRVWSAGCASGEEPYSMAILLHDAQLASRAHIIGTDIARSRLQRARTARYSRWSLRSVGDEVIDRCFVRRGREYELRAEYREAVEFRYLNLAEDRFPSLSTGIWGFDVVLCRNVLIYFDAAIVERVVAALVDSLADGGWLLLGAADPRARALHACEVLTTPAGLVYRKRANGRARSPERGPKQQQRPRQPASIPPPQPSRARAPAARPPVVSAPPDPASWRQRVRAAANAGELLEAERICVQALDRFPTDAELFYLHAVLLAEGGHHDAAARAARQALYLEPEFVVAHLALGNAYARTGRAAAAHRAFQNAERLLARMPADALVPASEEEPAGRLLSMTRVQMRLTTTSTET